MKLLADENFPRPALEALREAGNDVRSVAGEHPGITDEEVAGLCHEDETILLTFDKDFGELVFKHGLGGRASVVLFRFVPNSPMETLQVIRSLISAKALAPGTICTVARDKVRVRRFPNLTSG